ncbi:GerW family sporulation protein [uncultured Acetatifactor sp.]|uniref:GerW family sporulation protein n=1 Tax=uncultured Acetatifactor sp. TaxID=1671927 RepID=UPI002603C5E6|nr:GerW family sporulation protein [uncultured Acetatifactor sp.]
MAEKERENQFQGVVESLLRGMDTVLSTKTVVGEATKIGDTIILPLVDVSFGVGAGAGSNGQKSSSSGAGGLGGKMTPSAVLVIKDNAVKLVNIKNQDAVTKVLDMIPDLVDKFTKSKKKDGKAGTEEISDAEVVDIAFPEEETEEGHSVEEGHSTEEPED